MGRSCGVVPSGAVATSHLAKKSRDCRKMVSMSGLHPRPQCGRRRCAEAPALIVLTTYAVNLARKALGVKLPASSVHAFSRLPPPHGPAGPICSRTLARSWRGRKKPKVLGREHRLLNGGLFLRDSQSDYAQLRNMICSEALAWISSSRSTSSGITGRPMIRQTTRDVLDERRFDERVT